MRAVSVILFSFGALSLASTSFGITHVEASYGFVFTNPPLNNTLRTQQFIEASDLNYWGPDRVEAKNMYWRNGTFMPVFNSEHTYPPVPQYHDYGLVFTPNGSPLPPNMVGTWKTDASMALMVLWCDSTAIPIYCVWYAVCNQNLTEPCFDQANGFID